MNKYLSVTLFICLSVYLSACTTPTATPTATEIPTSEASPTPQINYSDILFKQPNEWPADIRAAHDKVLTDPWNASDAESRHSIR